MTKFFTKFFTSIYTIISQILLALFGKMSWKAPKWLAFLGGHKLLCTGLVVLGAAGYGGYIYLESLPKPVMVKATVQVPELPDTSSSTPSVMRIRFSYDLDALKADQVKPSGKPSIAPIELLKKEIKQGISIQPNIAGTWIWQNDYTIRFKPEQQWAPGVEYTINYEKDIFTPETILASDSTGFTTHPLRLDIDKLEFYQDPTDASIRRVVSTINSTHPIDKESLEKAISLSLTVADKKANATKKIISHTITYEKHQRTAYIQTEALELPEKESYMALAINKGVKSVLGGESTDTETSDKVIVPDIYSFLRLSSFDNRIVDNEKGEPEQLILMSFTDETDEEELKKHLEFYLFPKDRNGKKDYRWDRAKDLKDKNKLNKLLTKDRLITPELIPNPRSSSKQFSFRIDQDGGRYMFVRLREGMKSINNFSLKDTSEGFFEVPRYPLFLDFSGEGSLLSHSGDHKLSISSRNIKTLKYSIGRLADNQINHLVSQTDGDITNPYFHSGYFTKDNLVEYFEERVHLNPRHPKYINYSSFDLSRYLPEDNNRFGLFFVEINADDKESKKYNHKLKEQRLILITDLGIIVKNNNDHSHDVFVQSTSTGLPVANARIELLGKNGIPVLTATTSAQGHATLPVTSAFEDEEKPVAYIVKTDNDISFIPYDTHSRQINLSKFDIGGTSSSDDEYRKNLNVYGFTDRGIYRPGESVNLAYIVKRDNLDNVEGIPLELIITGPRQNRVARKRISLPELGFLDYNFETSPTSDTGRYIASLHIVQDNRTGITLGTTSFSVEEFQPDTMKINSQLLDVKGKAWSTQTALQAKVTLRNLFDVPAQNRRIEGQLIVNPSNFYFGKYSDYTFSPARINPNKPLLNINEALDPLTSNKDGEVIFDLNLDRFKEGTYRLEFSTQGYDQAGGRSVGARNSILISPLEFLVGYKANGKLNYINKGSKRVIDLIAIDNTLAKINKDDLVLKKIAVQKVSTLVKQNDGTYKYQTITKRSEVSSDALSISDKGHEYVIDTEEVGDFELEVYDADNHKLARVFYSVVGKANLTAQLDQNAELTVKLNKKDYDPGETIEMSIKAPYKGAGLITIETDKVQSFKWFKTDTQSTIETITVPEGLEGTAYVNISFVRDPSSKEIFTSPLSYAVKPFNIDKSKRRVNIDLDIPKKIKPGDTLEIGFTTDKQSRIAVFAVDEGILQVANYQTPKPLNHFLQKRALQVSTLQILDLILPEFNLLKELSASGGGSADKLAALAKNLNPFSRKVEAPAVYWSGIVDANTEQNSVNFTVPDTFSGTLRVMAVAVAESAFGATQTSTLVRGPFVITPNVLTQAAPSDEFIATVGVANIIKGSGKDAEIIIGVNSSEHLSVIGEPTQTINIAEGGEASVDFRVKATNKLGAAELTFNASLKTDNGTTNIETSSTRSATLSVRPISTYQSQFESGYSKKLPITLDVQRTLYPELSTQYASASSSPLVLVDGLNKYLEHYPHGCTEQIVSKVFPVLGLTAYASFEGRRERANELFSVAIAKLRGRQIGNGGFSFWPGGRSVSTYPTIYVTHFLIDAKEQGYAVPKDILNRVKSYLTDYVREPSNSLSEARIRANAIYLLTRLGEVSTNYLVDLHESLEKNHKKVWKKDLTASYMAATYQLLKNDKEANNLIKGYKLAQHNAKGYGDFHSPLTQDAQHLYLLATHFEKRLKSISGDQLLQFIDPIFKGEYNTISASYSILALGAYSNVISDALVDKAIQFSFTNQENKQEALTTIEGDFLQAPYDDSARQLTINLEEKNKNGLYYLNNQVGFDRVLSKKAIREGLEVYRDFLDTDGNVVTAATQGQILTTRLRVRALGNKRLTNIAVIDLLPGGFEIIRESVSRSFGRWNADYSDIREDRIVYYGSFDNTIVDLSYQVRVTAAGTFTVPPSYAQSMYDRSIKAQSSAGEIIVSKKDSTQ